MFNRLTLHSALVATLAIPVASAQQPAVQPPTSAQASPAPQAGIIRLNVQVTTKSGAPIQGLSQSDFTVLDNGAPRTIDSFRPVTRQQEPVEAILLFDAVNAPFQTLAFERDRIEAFLRADGGNLPVPFTVAILTDKGTQVLNTYSRDGNALAQSIEANAPGLREIRRSQGFWGAGEQLGLSLKAAQEVVAYASRQPGRKLLLWVSPGWPLLSGPGIQLDSRQQKQIFDDIVAFSTSMRTANVTLYSLDPIGAAEPLVRQNYYEAFVRGISTPRQTDLGDLSVQVLALQSGGFTLNTSDIGGMIRRALSDSESWYELSVTPAAAEHADTYHHLQIKVDRPDALVRTRDGYYAEP